LDLIKLIITVEHINMKDIFKLLTINVISGTVKYVTNSHMDVGGGNL